MATSNEVWYLRIDHAKKPVGRLFKVFPGDDVVDLKNKVKEQRSIDLAHVDAARLTVWRCTDMTTTFDNGDHEMLGAQVSGVFYNTKVTRLSERWTIAGLKVSKEETLLVELPSMLLSTLVISFHAHAV